jgi:hypothetical protein
MPEDTFMNDSTDSPFCAEHGAHSTVDLLVARAPAPAARSADIPVDLDDIHEQALTRLGRKERPLPPG